MMKEAGRAAAPPHDPTQALQVDTSELFALVEAVYVKHAAEWLPVMEAWWKVSQNPVFAWHAVWLGLHPAQKQRAIPNWTADYLFRSSSQLIMAMNALNPTEISGLTAHAFGLVAPKQNLIADARAYWEAPIVIGLFYHFEAEAKTRAKSEYACVKIRELLGLQSIEQTRKRVAEDRKILKAFLQARGLDQTEAQMQRTAHEALSHQVLVIDQLAALDPHPQATAADMRSIFASPLSRAAALGAALRGNLSA